MKKLLKNLFKTEKTTLILTVAEQRVLRDVMKKVMNFEKEFKNNHSIAKVELSLIASSIISIMKNSVHPYCIKIEKDETLINDRAYKELYNKIGRISTLIEDIKYDYIYNYSLNTEKDIQKARERAML